jgi:hypothetical protein
MKRHAIGLVLGAASVLALSAMAPAQDERDPAVKAARKDILAKAAPRGGKPALEDLMKVLALQRRGGLGFGKGLDPESGIEKKIIELQRNARGPSKQTLEKESKDLIDLANRTLAMAELTRPYFVKPMEGKGKKDWDRWLDEQKKASRDLLAAVRKEDGKAVSKAAKELLATCTDCHAHFRK